METNDKENKGPFESIGEHIIANNGVIYNWGEKLRSFKEEFPTWNDIVQFHLNNKKQNDMNNILGILNDVWVGKKIQIFEFDVFHKHTNKRIKHYHTNDSDTEKNWYTEYPYAWDDLKTKPVIVEITSISGYFDPYEGNSFNCLAKLDDNQEISFNITVEDNLNIIN